MMIINMMRNRINRRRLFTLIVSKGRSILDSEKPIEEVNGA